MVRLTLPVDLCPRTPRRAPDQWNDIHFIRLVDVDLLVDSLDLCRRPIGGRYEYLLIDPPADEADHPIYNEVKRPLAEKAQN